MDSKITSIDFDDDDKDYIGFNKYLEEDTNRKKNKALFEIEEMGDLYLKEIDRKKKEKQQKQIKLISYIIKHDKKNYCEEELLSYDFEDVMQIYKEIKEKKKPVIVKFLHFLLNIE